MCHLEFTDPRSSDQTCVAAVSMTECVDRCLSLERHFPFPPDWGEGCLSPKFWDKAGFITSHIRSQMLFILRFLAAANQPGLCQVSDNLSQLQTDSIECLCCRSPASFNKLTLKDSFNEEERVDVIPTCSGDPWRFRREFTNCCLPKSGGGRDTVSSRWFSGCRTVKTFVSLKIYQRSNINGFPTRLLINIDCSKLWAKPRWIKIVSTKNHKNANVRSRCWVVILLDVPTYRIVRRVFFSVTVSNV